MEEKIWKNEFKKKDVRFPKDIAIEYCNQLYVITDKKVIAKVEKYNKNFMDMNSNAPVFKVSSLNSLLESTKVEQFLGEVSGSDRFTYELYLTGKNTPNYKYRFCFIENGVYPYPVEVAIDNDIATELEIEAELTCVDEDAYKALLISILNSKKMKEVIEGLLTINSEEI